MESATRQLRIAIYQLEPLHVKYVTIRKNTLAIVVLSVARWNSMVVTSKD